MEAEEKEKKTPAPPPPSADFFFGFWSLTLTLTFFLFAFHGLAFAKLAPLHSLVRAAMAAHTAGESVLELGQKRHRLVLEQEKNLIRLGWSTGITEQPTCSVCNTDKLHDDDTEVVKTWCAWFSPAKKACCWWCAVKTL